MPPPPPQQKPNEVPQAQTTLVFPNLFTSGLAMIPLLFLIAFHVGAGYLSYQKYGNLGWASLDFLFPYFYYPYYAFFLAKEPAPTASVLPAMVGGKKGLNGLLKKLFK